MGDGGVACVPSQHVMERFPISDAFCGGNGGFNSKSLQYVESKLQRKHEKKMEVEKEEIGSRRGCRGESEKGLLGSGKSGEVEKGEIVAEKLQKEEIEEGELGFYKGSKVELENGEFVPEKLRKKELEKGEFLPAKLRKGGYDRGEFAPGRSRRGEVERGEYTGRIRKSEVEKVESIPDKWRKEEVERSELWRGHKGEVEKGEFIPEKWRKADVTKDEYGSTKLRKWEADKDDRTKGWKCEQERTPPSTRFAEDDAFHRKECSRSESERRKRSSKWEYGNEKDTRISSRTTNEELGSYKHGYSDGKGHSRENTSARLKRHGTESESSGRKYHGEFGDYAGSKGRRLSSDSNRSSYLEKHYSRSSMERAHKNSSSSRVSSSSRHSSRQCDSSLSSRTMHDRHGRSPAHPERSPHDRPRYQDHRDRSPGYSGRSPRDRSRCYDHRNRSPVHVERSPHDRARHRDRRDRTPGNSEPSPVDRGRSHNHRETSQKSIAGKMQHNRCENQGHDEKLSQRDSSVRDMIESTGKPQDSSSTRGCSVAGEKVANEKSHEEEGSQNLGMECKEPLSQNNGASEELLSMEEDMDISDTPPHVSVMADSTSGKWYYLDHVGIEQGPSKLCDLKRLVDEGVLMSDHLIKHLDTDRWVTVENAASPLVTMDFMPIVSDAITQLVSPPEAPGNLLTDVGDYGQSVSQHGQEPPVNSQADLDDSSVAYEPLEDLGIDERVGSLLKGYTIVPGRELETIGEALQMTFEHAEWEKWGGSEGHLGFMKYQPGIVYQHRHQKEEEFRKFSEITLKEAEDSRLIGHSDKDCTFACADSSDWFSGRWSCKGGDWKRNDGATQDRSFKRKLVLNDGYPLCQMPKSGYEDPRWQKKDELYYPSRSRRLDLPTWAFSWPEERHDCNGLSRPNQSKQQVVVRGVKGTMLPVIRINACVVKDHGSFVSEPHMKSRRNERHYLRSASHSSACDDGKSSSRSKRVDEHDLHESQKFIAPINTPKDRVCTVDELQLQLGDWYYLDGAGREHGPLSFSGLQVLVDKGTIENYSSIFRKFDNVWVPIVSTGQVSNDVVDVEEEKKTLLVDASRGSLSESLVPVPCGSNTAHSSFHSLHPQFVGYTRGRLHELVMKSYKSREFAAAINEVLDPWMSAKQPKKELDRHSFTSATNRSSLLHDPVMYKFRKSEDGASGNHKDYIRYGKRARLLGDGSEDDSEMEEYLATGQKDECHFEDLFDGSNFGPENFEIPAAQAYSWCTLNGPILARVFHFLKADIRSLAFSAATCTLWNAAVKFYRDVCRHVDLSFAGPNCTDSMFRDIMNGYNKEKITSVSLLGCTNISSSTLEDILHSFPCISLVNIRGCIQFKELMSKFQNIKWIKSSSLHVSKVFEESHSKTRSLKQITERSFPVSKASKGFSSHLDDPSEHGYSYDRVSTFDRKDLVSRSFRQNLYKRRKLCDAGKSSYILSRDARMRRWLRGKSENGYRRVEDFLANSLKDIMKDNTIDFFVPKVAEIEDRMKNGYYIGHGLSSVKDDIGRMCRDALKAKTRGDAGDINHIIKLFLRLARSLEENHKSPDERNDMMKTLKDSPPAGFYSATSKYKKHNRMTSERKCFNRTNGASINGGMDCGEYASDREIRRRLIKLNKRSLDSGSETSDDPERSSDDGSGDSESTVSDTENDLDFRFDSGIGDSRDGYSTADETEDREWGARMTKASLVPPVTRKYEVIDKYVIVADEEEVQQKMRVSLPEDYAEKLKAQKNGSEESDMEIPEVKDYKPRKMLGDEVLEQEVYGIDPYTHNLLLDSMPEELDWPLLKKHAFIEDVLLRVLNKQVRNFTGTGNTPMIYPLKPVVEDVHEKAEKSGDTNILKMCQGILKAMESRRDDTYVAYRKGLGVVCNKEGGFDEDDFVVEFLGEVYPVWKWFEKQDGIRSLQKNNKDPAPEFYNIYLERPKGDGDGYDLVVVDAMHKANFASRICHSCRPNCEAKVTAVDGNYQIGIYTVRPIGHGEEITFDYNSVTESKEEYEASICLCGSKVCRGSYLNLTGEGAFQKVLLECHGILDRHKLMLEACELNCVSEEDYIDLARAGLGTCLLGGLPDWLIAYSARLVRFINFERTKLPEEILRHNIEEKRKFFSDISVEDEKNDAEVQAEGVYNQRLQNLAVTLDKVRYVMRRVFGDPKKAPPPLEKLGPEAVVSVVWKGEGSLVEELLQYMAPHLEEDMLNELRFKILAHDPSGSDDIQRKLRKSLLWLRDEVRNLPCTYKCRHDAAADLIHIYAYTRCFFRVREYDTVTSPPVYITPLDLGPKYSHKLGSGFQEYCKTYGENYCLGKLIFWHNQDNAEPDCSLARAQRGCLSLPDIASFYAKVQKPSRHRVYGPRTLRFMLARMEKQPQRPWPRDRIWSFKSDPRVFGTPMLDAVLNESSLDREMVNWLKNRTPIYQAMWDR